eukprot:gene17481-12502_t
MVIGHFVLKVLVHAVADDGEGPVASRRDRNTQQDTRDQ